MSTMDSTPGVSAPFARNGYALLEDLETPALVESLRAMEAFQARWMAATRDLWKPDFRYTGDRLDNWSRRWEYPYVARNLAAVAPGRVLDAGSGVNFFPFHLAQAGWTVTCADINPDLVAIYADANSRLPRPVEYRLASIDSLPWPDASFDAVYSISVLEHAPGRVKAMDEFARVLTPGGRLVLTWDVSLSRDCDILLEDVAVLLAQLEQRFEPEYPLDLLRTDSLLTTERMLDGQRWRLSWRPHVNPIRRAVTQVRHGDPFRTLAVMGTCWRKRG